jgi:hypothetical protein
MIWVLIKAVDLVPMPPNGVVSETRNEKGGKNGTYVLNISPVKVNEVSSCHGYA